MGSIGRVVRRILLSKGNVAVIRFVSSLGGLTGDSLAG